MSSQGRIADGRASFPLGSAEPIFRAAVLALRKGDHAAAETAYKACLARDPDHAEAHRHLGLLLAKRGDTAGALRCLRRAVELRPDDPDSQSNLATVLRSAGQAEGAVAAARTSAALTPGDATAQYGHGLALLQNGDFEAAARTFSLAALLNPTSARLRFLHAEALRQANRPAEALAACQQGLALAPDDPEGLNCRGLLLEERGDEAGALASFQAALSGGRADSIVFTNVAHLHLRQYRLDEALVSAEAALALDPANSATLGNLGTIAQRQGRIADAIDVYRRAIELAPDCAQHFSNLGALYIAVDQSDEAIAACQRAVLLSPKDSAPQFNLAVALRQKGLRDEAVTAYRSAAAKGSAEALVDLCHLRQQLCDWDGLAEEQAEAQRSTYRQGRRVAPFSVLAATDSAGEQRCCAEVYAAAMPRVAPLSTYGDMQRAEWPGKIRLGYPSADFCQHATASLIAELIEQHDRNRFEVFGYSYGPDDGSPLRTRLAGAFDSFVDLRASSHEAAAQRIAADGVEILIDLKGYTEGARTEILAYRPAPIQVNYLGYPGTMGAPFIDYLVADSFVAPPAHATQFSEKVIRLPDCYQPNDRARPVAESVPDRSAFGLPVQGFVFCSFNNSYKITAAVFDIWMRLLAALPNSVLWLLDTGPTPRANLRKEAARRGIAPEHLIFAPRVPADQHIARMGLADLFLDTYPVTAHTTASEALWAGLPVLTCAGESFVSRVAGSLLQTIGLPELVTTDLAAYEAVAIQLAREPDLLAQFRERLAANRSTSPLFDTPRYVAGFEDALLKAVALHRAGKPPEYITISSGDGPAPRADSGSTDPRGTDLPMAAAPRGPMAFAEPWAVEKNRYCLWIVSPKGYAHQHAFDEVAVALSEAFAKRGGSAPIVHHPSEWKGRRPIVLGPHLVSPNVSLILPPGSVLFNMEQVDTRSDWMNGPYLDLLKKHAVLDYSIRNRVALAGLGVTHARTLSLGYADGLARIKPAPEQDIDVLFYGSLNPRRSAVLDALQARGMRVVPLFGTYGPERDAAIARAKLVLNLHFYEAAIFETVRVTYLLANAACVVSEGDPADPDCAPYAEALALCPYEQIVTRCLDLLARPEARVALAQRGLAVIKARRQAELLGALFPATFAPESQA